MTIRALLWSMPPNYDTDDNQIRCNVFASPLVCYIKSSAVWYGICRFANCLVFIRIVKF